MWRGLRGHLESRSSVEPLGRLTIHTSYRTGRTKTGVIRYVPVHPVLAAMLAEWKVGGWEKMMGRPPMPEDFIIPLPPTDSARKKKPGEEMRDRTYCWKRLRDDLKALGLRHRRFHDLRRTFISLGLDDGAIREMLKEVTHTRASRDVFDSYTTLQWKTLCGEVAKLRIDRSARGQVLALPVPAAAAGGGGAVATLLRPGQEG